MNGHAPSRLSTHYEEKFEMLQEISSSDVESDAGQTELEHRFARKPMVWASAGESHARASCMVLKSAPWWSLAKRSACFLLPSFLQAMLAAQGGDRRPVRLGPTSYLDGMRGVAAFAVFLCHYSYMCFVIAEGWGNGENNRYFLKLPFVRLFYQGSSMVCIFFVVSGYALSLKPLKLARARKMDGLATTIASFTLRRGFRLYMPTAISTLMIVLMIQAGFYEWTRDFAADPTYLRNIQEEHYQRMDTFRDQIGDWINAMFSFVHVWGWEKFGGSTGIDPHLWTISVEYRASMMLFLTLIGAAKLRTALRLVVVAGLFVFCYLHQRWDMMLFYAGMVLAELDLIRGAHADPFTTAAVPSTMSWLGEAALSPLLSQDEPFVQGPVVSRRRCRSYRLLWTGLSIVSLYLMSQPDSGGETTPGWVVLTGLIPQWWEEQYWYWRTAGAILFVAAVARLPGWQRCFNTGVAQYLGHISYAIYLMHGPVLHTVGFVIERWAWQRTGVETELAYNTGFVLASLPVIPAVIWAADVFWRAVDTPVVRFAKWLEAKCSVPDEGEAHPLVAT